MLMFSIKSIKKSLLLSLFLVLMVSPWASVAPAFFWRGTLWQVIAHSYSLLPTANNLPPNAVNKVQTQINLLLADRGYIGKISKNAEPFLYYVYQATTARHMPSEIALLPLLESDYYPFCLSNRGAEGIWQMMPGTARDLHVSMNWWYDGRRDLISATHGALNHLAYLHSEYGDWLIALAAYNAGEVPVNAAIRYNRSHHLPINYWYLKLPKQTEEYVPKLIALAKILQYPSYYRVNLTKVPDSPLITAIPLKQQINMQALAGLIHMDSSQLLRLNAGFRRWVTPPGSGYTLIVPQDKTKLAMRELNELSPDNIWQHYRVKSGDTLSTVGEKYHISTTTLSVVNHLSTHRIKTGQLLLIPYDYSGSKNKAPKSSYEILFATHDRSADHSEDAAPRPEPQGIHKSSNAHQMASHHASTHKQLVTHQVANKTHSVTHHKATVASRSNHYEIKQGDSLSTIARRFHTSVAALKSANHLTHNTIRAGKSLTIP